MASPQTLDDADRRLAAIWAADCAKRVLPIFESASADDDRARDGIERARAYGNGQLDAASEIQRRFLASRAAQSATSPAAIAAARAAGQASTVAHMGAHALGAAAFAAKAASLAADDRETARRGEVRWQLAQMTPDARAALARLPLLGEDTSGPLGAGLLSKGMLAETIREIQADLTATDRRPSTNTCKGMTPQIDAHQ